MTKQFKSKNKSEEAYFVRIVGRRPDKSRPNEMAFEVAEDDLAHRFLQWLCERPDIFNIEGSGGSSGMGSYSGVFPIRFKSDIEQWFKENTP